MPEGLAGTAEIMTYLSREISENTYVNIMPQYRPCGLAGESPKLRRPLLMQEYRDAVNDALRAGIYRLDKI
jgi:putative pyruvate formate lyase activating enzyme